MFSLIWFQSLAEALMCCIEVITLASVLYGGILAFLQWRRSAGESKAKFLKSLLEEFYNTEIVDFFYEIDYGNFTYDEEFHLGPQERITDKALSLASYICYLRETNVVSEVEFKFFQYDIDRLARNREIRKYIHFLLGHAKKNATEFSYQQFYDYAKRKGFIKEELFEKGLRK